MPAEDRADLKRRLGDWKIAIGAPEILAETQAGGSLVRDLAFRSSRDDRVPAVYAVPMNASGPMPALLYCHAHGNRYDIGAAELVQGRPAMQSWLADLTGLGLAVLCVDMPTFGARQQPAEPALAKALLWQGQTLFGLMLAELAAGLDWLAAAPGIDPDRMGALGFSMGATQAFWMAALDPRLRAVVHIGAYADLGALIATGAHDAHGPYMTVPGLLPDWPTGRICGLIAPRPQLVCAGLRDASTPAQAVAIARAQTEAAYRGAGARQALAFHLDPEAGHQVTPAMRAAALAFLARHLVG